MYNIYVRFTLVVLVAVSVVACAGVGATVRVDPKTLKSIQDSLVILSDAIPGGQYTRIIGDLNGGDPDKRAAAQAFLRSLGDLDPEEQKYDVTVWFDFDTPKPLHATGFRAATPSPEEIQTRYSQGFLLNAGEVSSTPLRGPTFDEAKAKMEVALSNAITTVWELRDIQPQARDPYGPGLNPFWNSKRDQAVASFVRAIEVLYREQPLSFPVNIMSYQWPLFDERQTLFILIPEEDWIAHNGNIRVRALLHKRGEPGTPLPGVQSQDISKDEWNQIELQGPYRPMRKFRWALRTMTDMQLLSAATIEKIRAVREALAEWQKLQDN